MILEFNLVNYKFFIHLRPSLLLVQSASTSKEGYFCLMKTTVCPRGSKKLTAMSRNKMPPLLK